MIMFKRQILYQRYPINVKLTQKVKYHFNISKMNVRLKLKTKRYKNIGKITL